MKVYAILLSYDNSDEKLMNDNVVRILKEHHGGAVIEGFDLMRYVGCFVFKRKFERDACARELQYAGIKFDTRDDGNIGDQYERNFD